MLMGNLKFCILLPCYESHSNLLAMNIEGYKSFGHDLIIIDDGSSPKYQKVLSDIAEATNSVLLRCDSNSGKGYSIKKGLKYAHERGYTHALQIDSDGQHDARKIPDLVNKSRQDPGALISGYPVFDKSVPRSRLYGRYITHFWVWLETLNFNIVDSMCGFRSYPVEASYGLIAKESIGNRMDFDTEILVKLYWNKVRIKFIPVSVIYPESGISHFKMIRDNIMISMMHSKLFFGMMLRLPTLIRIRSKKEWHGQNEKGIVCLMKLTFWILKNLNRKILDILISFISFYYYMLSAKARRNSKIFNRNYKEYCKAIGRSYKKFGTYQHIHSFSKMIVDKFLVWDGSITRKDLRPDDVKKYYLTLPDRGGAIYISSHLGNIEIVRAIGLLDSNVKCNVLMYQASSSKIFSVLNEINPNIGLNIIDIDKFGVDLGLILKEKVKKNELIFCMGDRISLRSEKRITTKLLGKEVSLPFGPFFLGHLLNIPMYSFHCYKEGDLFRIQTERLTPPPLKKMSRKEFIDEVVGKYITSIENILLIDPLQWFNFNEFWSTDEEK